MVPVNVRRAEDGDLRQLLELEDQSFSGDRISARSWKALIRSPSAVALVARQQQVLAGAAVVLTRRNSTIARLYSLAVAPAFRGAGVGAELLESTMDCARMSGAAQLRLESRTDNSAAHRLFRRLGFEQFGPVLDGYYQDGVGALRFRRSLVDR